MQEIIYREEAALFTNETALFNTSQQNIIAYVAYAVEWHDDIKLEDRIGLAYCCLGSGEYRVIHLTTGLPLLTRETCAFASAEQCKKFIAIVAPDGNWKVPASPLLAQRIRKGHIHLHATHLKHVAQEIIQEEK